MRRTTIRLDDDLMHQAKRFAADRGITLTTLIDGALRERLARGREQSPAGAVDLPTFGTREGRLMPGVDLTDNASLRDLMEGDSGLERRR